MKANRVNVTTAHPCKISEAMFSLKKGVKLMIFKCGCVISRKKSYVEKTLIGNDKIDDTEPVNRVL